MFIQHAGFHDWGMRMRRVNLLPTDIVSRCEWRRKRPHIIAGCVGLSVIVSMWVVAAFLQYAYLSGQLESLSREVELAEMRALSFRDIQERIAFDKAIARSDIAIAEPVQMSSVISLLSRILPDGVCADYVAVSMPPVLMTNKRLVGSAGDVAGKVAAIHIDVKGVAFDEHSLPLLISNVTRSQMINNMRIIDQRDVRSYSDSAQYFHITLQVPLAVVEPGPAGQVGGV